MNLAKLKAYAPQARVDFIQAVTERAALFGLSQPGKTLVVLPMVKQGSSVMIGGKAFDGKVEKQRVALEARMERDGFTATIEGLAATWFNRLVALRYMDVHGYHDHGYRVLSPSPHAAPGAATRPEILEQAEHLQLGNLDVATVVKLKLDGNKDAELYRMLLLAQCEALHTTMPAVFPKLDDDTELMLPDNLLHSDSLITTLVQELTEEDCSSVEVLGWLYQFYIAQKKEAVMKRKSAVPTEDIPAVTQLFTPHWIVRYLVENSLGRLWLLNRPGSQLRAQMPYYIESAPANGPEADFLKITKPEEIQVCDPAVGSGHMLTYAFDLLVQIYEEEGYAPNEIPGLILQHNLHGLDICPRAAQLATLALVFKAREKSRRFFEAGQFVAPRIIELQDVQFSETELRDYVRELKLGTVFEAPVFELMGQFEQVKNFGSLIQPCMDERSIGALRSAIEVKDLGSHLFLVSTHQKVLRVLDQAEALTPRYHVVVANPPYLGSGAMNGALRQFAKNNYADSKADLFAMFIERGFSLTVPKGYIGMITMQSWMFLSSYEELRVAIVSRKTIVSMAHLGEVSL